MPAAAFQGRKSSRIRLLLQAFERSLYDKRTEQVPVPGGLTIEHIMPKAWEEHWLLPDGADKDAVDFRNHIVHTIGNLALLTQELNSTESCGPWTKEKLAMIRYSKLLMNSHIHAEEVWDEKAIPKRAMLVAARVGLIWPRPQAG